MNSQFSKIIQNQRDFYNSQQTKDIEFRILQLSTLRDLILEYEERISDALWQDLHKPKFEAYTTEIGIVLAEISMHLKHIRSYFGDDPRQSSDYGRIITQKKTERLVQLMHDATILCGGEAIPQERYLAPTIVGGISSSHPLMQEEIFGPVLPMMEYDSLDEVIDFINTGAKPLALYLFTGDPKKERKMLALTSSGGACINDTLIHFSNKRLPFGGIGQSGFGRYHGKYSFETFSHPRSVMKKVTWLDIPIRYPPYGEKLRLIKRLLK